MPSELSIKMHIKRVFGPVVLLAVLLPLASAQAESGDDPSGLSVETESTAKPVSGDVLNVPAAPDSGSEVMRAKPVLMPRHGMSMSAVEKEFGRPRERHAAVGRPPITRWDYNDFSVFFEYHTVIDAVQPDNPPPIEHKNELIGAPSTPMPSAHDEPPPETLPDSAPAPIPQGNTSLPP